MCTYRLISWLPPSPPRYLTPRPRKDMGPEIPYPKKGHGTRNILHKGPGTRDTLSPGKDMGPEIPYPIPP